MTRNEILEYVESKIVPPYKIVIGNGVATPGGMLFWDAHFDAIAILIGRYDNGNVISMSVSGLELLKNSNDVQLKELLDDRFVHVMKTWELYLEKQHDVSA